MTAAPDNVVDLRDERAHRKHGVTFGHMRGLCRQALGAAILARRPEALAGIPAAALEDVCPELVPLWRVIATAQADDDLELLAKQAGCYDPDVWLDLQGDGFGNPETIARDVLSAWREVRAFQLGDRLATATDAGARTALARQILELEAGTSTCESYETLGIDSLLDADIPPAKYLLPGVEEGDTFGLFGPTGSSKTLWTLAVGLALASGRPLFGEWQIDRRYRVLMLSEEDSTARTIRRVRRLCACMGIERGEIQDTFRILSKSGFVSTNPNALDRLRRTLDSLKSEVVFIDSINQTSGIKALKDAEAVREYYRDRIEPLRAVPSLRLICTVGHTNKGAWNKVQQTDPEALVFGSQDFLAATDASLLIRKHQKEPNLRVVECLKVRDGEKPNPVEIEIFNDRIASPDKTACPFALLYRRALEPDEAEKAVRRPTKVAEVTDYASARPSETFTKAQLREAVGCSDESIDRAVEAGTLRPAGRAGRAALFQSTKGPTDAP